MVVQGEVLQNLTQNDRHGSIPSVAEKAKPMVMSRATIIGMSGCLEKYCYQKWH